MTMENKNKKNIQDTPSSTLSPKGRKRIRGNKKEIILDAAIYEFARNGFKNTEVQSIAERCSFSKGTVYLYFKSKDDLFWEGALFILKQVENIMNDVCAQKLPPLDKIRATLVRCCELMQKSPQYISILTQIRSVPKELRPKEIDDFTQNVCFICFCKLFQEAEEMNLIAKFDPEDCTISLINTYWGVLLFYNPEEDKRSMRKRIDFTLDVFLNGLQYRTI